MQFPVQIFEKYYFPISCGQQNGQGTLSIRTLLKNLNWQQKFILQILFLFFKCPLQRVENNFFFVLETFLQWL